MSRSHLILMFSISKWEPVETRVGGVSHFVFSYQRRDVFHDHYDNHLLGYLGSAGSFSDFTFKTKALRPSHLLHWYDFFLVVRTKVVGNGKALSLPCWCIPFCWCHCYPDFSYKKLNYLEHNKNPPEGSWSEKTGFIYLLAPSAIPTY